MTKSKRQNEILDYLSTIESCAIQELCDRFNVSVNTIRRDIDELFKQNLIIKFYGGLKLVRKSEDTYSNRNSSQIENKKKIVRFAASLVNEKDSIFVDAGTTNALLADYIPRTLHLNITTNNFNFIEKAKDNENWNITIIGRKFKSSSRSFIDEINWDYYNSLNFDKAFLGTTGFTIKSGATNPDAHETIIKSTMMKRANDAILLADETKFDQTSLYTFAKYEEFQKIITSGNIEQNYFEHLSNAEVTLIVV